MKYQVDVHDKIAIFHQILSILKAIKSHLNGHIIKKKGSYTCGHSYEMYKTGDFFYKISYEMTTSVRPSIYIMVISIDKKKCQIIKKKFTFGIASDFMAAIS